MKHTATKQREDEEGSQNSTLGPGLEGALLRSLLRSPLRSFLRSFLGSLPARDEDVPCSDGDSLKEGCQ